MVQCLSNFRVWRHFVVAACLLILVPCYPTWAQPRPPERPGQPQRTVASALAQAHRAVESAVVDVSYASYFSYPGETEFFITNYRVVLDRKANRVRLDRPGYTLICDGKDILLFAEDLPGRHLRVQMQEPLTYEQLVGVLPDLNNPMSPALILLLAEDPMGWLSGGVTQQASAFTPKRKGAERMTGARFSSLYGTAELLSDRRTQLMDDLMIEADAQQLVGTGLDAVRFHYEVKWSAVNQPVDEKLFTPDLANSVEATTLAQFLAAPANPNNAATAGAGGAGGQQQAVGQPGAGGSLIGQPLPDIELSLLGGEEKINLSKLDKGVVVLECFASWTRPSVLDLPALSDFKAWAEKEEKQVTIYGVAVGETAESTTQWLEALEKAANRKVDVPVLLDTDNSAAVKLGLPTVPRTLIIVDGKIVAVYGGVKPTFLDDLKKGLPGWIESVKEQLKPQPESE